MLQIPALPSNDLSIISKDKSNARSILKNGIQIEHRENGTRAIGERKEAVIKRYISERIIWASVLQLINQIFTHCNGIVFFKLFLGNYDKN